MDVMSSFASARHRSPDYCSFVRLTSGSLFASLDFPAIGPQLLKQSPKIQAEEIVSRNPVAFKFGLDMLLWSRHQLSESPFRSIQMLLASGWHLRSSSTFSWPHFQGSKHWVEIVACLSFIGFLCFR